MEGTNDQELSRGLIDKPGLRRSDLLLIFDLDGTLIDSREDLAISTNATRAEFGLPPLTHQTIQSYVGDGAATLVRRALQPETDEGTVAAAVAFFLKFYRTHSLRHTRLYDGVAEAIAALDLEGYALAVLTNKPVRVSVDILDALGLAKNFFRIYGGDSFPEKKPSPLGITALLEDAPAGLRDTWMIGDSGVDIQTARNAGVRACGVSWGFQPDTFALHAPDKVVNSPGEWLPLFRNDQVL